MAKNTKELVQDMTDYLNSFSRKESEFCKEMSCEHRTLQQNFTRLCLSWIEYCATDEYRVDGRNEMSKEVAKRIMDLWSDKMKGEGYSSFTLEVVDRPSNWLPTI